MKYAYQLQPADLPAWLDFDGMTWATAYLTPEQLASQGWLPLVYDPEGALLGYATDPCVEETRNGQQVAVAYALATSEEEAAEAAEQLRAALSAEIDAQIPEVSATQRAIDPLVTADVLRFASAASDKHIELDGTVDAELEQFDPALDVLSPGADVGYSRFAVSITKQEPWAGQPANTLGFEAVIQTAVGQEATGAEARLYVVDAPADTTAVLPFTREGDLWYCRSRDGYKWADEALSCTVQLLWGSGSLAVSPALTCPAAYQRAACAVRYGAAVSALQKTRG
jgi:hypothetical protein